ncbi:MAG: hypothetical protein RR925_08385 [Erysipelotrichaceae bacterium]
MKNKKRYLFIVLVTLFFFHSENIHAGSIAPNSNFTIEVQCGYLEGAIRVTASNATIISASNFCDRGRSVSATARAGASGTASITFTGIDTVDTSVVPPIDASERHIGSGSVSIIPTTSGGGTTTPSKPNPSNPSTTKPNAVAPLPSDKRSFNNNLISLSISKGKLAPTFSRDVTNYKVSLEADVTEIELKGMVEDSKANIIGNGKHGLKAGKNLIELICTAENEATKSYLIEIMVDEKPLIFTNFEKNKLGVVRNLEGLQIPHGFQATTIKMNGKQINAWYNPNTKKTLVYLVNDNGEKNFYLYNKKVTSIYKQVTLTNKAFYIISVPDNLKEMQGYTYQQISIDGQLLDGWKFNDKQFKNFTLVYLMNEDNKPCLYQYEKTSNSLQPFSNTAPITQSNYELVISSNNTKFMFFVIVSLLLITTNIFTIVYFRRKNKLV